MMPNRGPLLTLPEKHRLLCLLFFMPLLQVTVGQVSANSVQTWTFNQPGVSRLDFRPNLTTGQNHRYSFFFRTRNPNGKLMHHMIPNLETARIPSLTAYGLFLELTQGQLRAVFQVNHYQDYLTIGKALHDDDWHSVDVVVDLEGGEMKLTLDGETESVKAYTWSNTASLLLWTELESLVVLGGSRSRSKVDSTSFTGCIRDVEYALGDGTLVSPAYNTTMGVSPGCQDRCLGDKTCNMGHCVNLYSSITCDCHGTGHEGPRCEEDEITTMTFHGYEWLSYQLYTPSRDRLFTDRLRVSFEFKTNRGSGVLLYAVGGTPFHSHVTVSIHSGAVHASLAFEEDDITFKGGIGLDDDRWHNLTIEHNRDLVIFYLDDNSTPLKVTKGGHYLNLDPHVFIGGGDNFVQTKGLPVTQSFVGCLRNLYINDVSILYQLAQKDSRCEYNGGKEPKYGCQGIGEVPISFPRSSSMMEWDIGEREQNLSIEFKMRTFHKNAIVVFVELISRKGATSGFDFGTLELWIQDQMALLKFNPSSLDTASHQTLTLPVIISDGLVHQIGIHLFNSKVKLLVDGSSAYSRRYHKILEHRGKVILGYSLRRISTFEGFIGCLHKIVIQGKKIDPIAVIETDAVMGVILDGCQLVDHCSENNICEHDSTCLSDWQGIHCVCSDGHYEGKACHFSKYASSCEDYYRMGYHASGVYLIDVDTTGPITPSYVQCDMDLDNHLGKTVVEHNFPENTTVRAPWLPDAQYHLLYREMSREQLTTLTNNAEECEQYIQYDCLNSPIKLSEKTWFKSTTGEIVDYIGSERSGFCECPTGYGCEGEDCYCDLNQSHLRTDQGYNRQRHQLPVMEMFFLQNHRGQATFTLGPLKCWGSELQPLGRSITMIRSDSYVLLQPWHSGELRLNFKTHQSQAMLLYHSSQKQENEDGFGDNPDVFYVKIISAKQVQFYMKIGEFIVTETLGSRVPLDEGNWHSLIIDHDPYNVRLRLDSNRTLISLPDDGSVKIGFTGHLYLGGVSDRIIDKAAQTPEGFTGCFYGFVYNGEAVDLQTKIDDRMSGVSRGCMSSCWPNPCENEGVCEERWGTYRCVCRDPWAHLGENCSKDLNLDTVTFSGLPDSYLMFDVTDHPEVLDGTIVLSFRTLLSQALLLYVHDHLGNYVQLDLSDPFTVTVSFNDYNQIVRDSVRLKEVLNDGEWHQVVAENYHNYTRLIVKGESIVVEKRRGRIRVFTLDPYYGSIDHPTTYIARPRTEPSAFITVYIGGVKDSASSIQPLVGCVRGARIGKYVFQLEEQAVELDNDTVVARKCEAGCNENSCHHNGACIEKWRDGQFECNCKENGFSGFRCEIEPSVQVKGNTVVTHNFQLDIREQYSSSQSLSFRFKSDPLPYTSYKVVMVYIYSSEDEDYILATLDGAGDVMVETKQGIGILYRIKVKGSFADGNPHDFTYIRQNSDMYLEVKPLDPYGNVIVDEIKEAKLNYPDYPLNKIDTLNIGGYIHDSDEMQSLFNFSGCISNVAYTPKHESETVIHTLRDLYVDVPGILVVGEETQSCSTSQEKTTLATLPPRKESVTAATYMDLTMPPWLHSDLQIVTLSAPPSQKTPPTTVAMTTTLGMRNVTFPVILQGSTEINDDVFVVIVVTVVCVIAAILILSLCCTLLYVRCRKNRGDYLVKKEGGENDIELKEPLNHTNHVPPYTPSPFSSNTVPRTVRPRPPVESTTNHSQVPSDHLAKLDEFSMITAYLGPKTPKADTIPPDPSKQRYGQGNYPLTDDEMEYINPIYNAKKQRPASSISEVLEELERRQQPLSNESSEDAPLRSHGEGDLEWDPQGDTIMPMRNEDITFFNSPLLAPIPDELEDSHLSSFSGHPSSFGGDSDQKDTLEGSTSPPGSSHMTSGADGNGDSGYEAESRPEATEDDMTPEMLNDDDEQFRTPYVNHHKMFSFHVPELHTEPSPNLSRMTPQERLLHEGTSV